MRPWPGCGAVRGLVLALSMLTASRCSHPAAVTQPAALGILPGSGRSMCVRELGSGGREWGALRLRGGRTEARESRLDAQNDRMADKFLAFYAKDKAAQPEGTGNSSEAANKAEGDADGEGPLSKLASPDSKLNHVTPPPVLEEMVKLSLTQMSGTQPLHRNVLWYRGGLVFEAHRLLYHSAQGSRTCKDL